MTLPKNEADQLRGMTRAFVETGATKALAVASALVLSRGRADVLSAVVASDAFADAAAKLIAEASSEPSAMTRLIDRLIAMHDLPVAAVVQ